MSLNFYAERKKKFKADKFLEFKHVRHDIVIIINFWLESIGIVIESEYAKTNTNSYK